MNDTLFTQLVAFATGMLLLTAVLQTWRRSLPAGVRLLMVQGAALAGLVAVLGLRAGHEGVWVAAFVVLAVKAVLVPVTLLRTAAATGETGESGVDSHPIAGVLASAGLTLLAYVISQPVIGAVRALAARGGSAVPPWAEASARAVPVGLALVLIGLSILLLRGTALSQLLGFLVLDNGIATVALLTSGGLPLMVELGVLLDVLLIILILRALAARMRTELGGTELVHLTELRDG